MESEEKSGQGLASIVDTLREKLAMDIKLLDALNEGDSPRVSQAEVDSLKQALATLEESQAHIEKMQTLLGNR